MDPDSNPLLPQNTHNLPTKREKVVQPLPANPDKKTGVKGATEAVSLLRSKIEDLYSHEPSAKEEQAEAEAAGRHRSRHQEFMHRLSTSGRSLAEIQTAWHQYYTELPNEEKHAVWQEFYSEHSRVSQQQATEKPSPTPEIPQPTHQTAHRPSRPKRIDQRTISDIKSELLNKVSAKRGRKGKAGHSVLFGLAMGGIVAFFMLFGFFNERFIAPFVTPSKSVSNTPIIIDPSTTAVGPESKIIIPKINVEIPIVFDEPSIDEAAVQRALESGVIHYATTSRPGESGNGAIFGHSSNNILNKGKYKFAFVLLKRLENGDVFYVQKDGKRYAYKVYKKQVVSPEQIEVLGAQDKPSTMSLITCDPPGTSINRLVVVGEQISPDPGQNVASSAQQSASAPVVLPSNSPTLWSRFTSWLSS